MKNFTLLVAVLVVVGLTGYAYAQSSSPQETKAKIPAVKTAPTAAEMKSEQKAPEAKPEQKAEPKEAVKGAEEKPATTPTAVK